MKHKQNLNELLLSHNRKSQPKWRQINQTDADRTERTERTKRGKKNLVKDIDQ